MELHDFAEQVLFSATLEGKLACPPVVTDERPGPAIMAPLAPGRPPELRFKPQHTRKSNVPRVHSLEQPDERGRTLHFFANHELLATELMALVLLRFPNAPSAFRRGVLQTLKDEQEHTRLYLRRMRECGIAFGELPVSGYFWRAISSMESPLDYVAGLSLTFEQANLDFARYFGGGFARIGDQDTAQLLDRIYKDEIGHVATGLKWLRKWKNPQQSDWEAFCQQLKFPLSAQRAKGPAFNLEGRLAAGLDLGFINELKVYSQSKGRTPSVFVFNPFAEGYIARGKTFTPSKHQRLLQQDLENLPQFLCRQDDVILVERRPSSSFLNSLKESGFVLPEFVELQAGRIDPAANLLQRQIGKLCPWAWGPDSVELLRPLSGNVRRNDEIPDQWLNQAITELFSKATSTALLNKVVARHPDFSSWLCSLNEVGVVVDTVPDALAVVESIRSRGHQKVLAKQTFGVAGQNAIRLFEPQILDNQERWIANIVENGGSIVIEPWLERELDFSVQLEMLTTGLKLVGYTGLLNDPNGQFRGNWAWPNYNRCIPTNLATWFPTIPAISNHIRIVFATVFSLLEAAFRDAGYCGPAGIDAFIYRSPAGGCRLKPVVEVNPRYTMGRLTLDLMKRVAPGSAGTLRLVNLPAVRRTGCEDFATWHRAMVELLPIRLEGEPIQKIREGMVFLNDPALAQFCLATFEVGTLSSTHAIEPLILSNNRQKAPN